MDSQAINLHVGQKLKARRKLLGLNQRELAEKVGVAYQQVQKYEKGLNRIGANMIYNFANVLEVNISYFFEGYEDNSTKEDVVEKLDKSFKYKELSTSKIEELVIAFSKIDSNMQRNIITLMKDLASKDQLVEQEC